mmetsp:Transcript_3751/g.14033  ORF Transcript_3751/g.14033 Transcript_3751/m.14033 type:complete len:213 (+) Transcript_3751:296-934(+)
MRRLQRVNVRVRGRPAALKVLAAHQARVHVVRDERDAAALLKVKVEQRAVHGVEVRALPRRPRRPLPAFGGEARGVRCGVLVLVGFVLELRGERGGGGGARQPRLARPGRSPQQHPSRGFDPERGEDLRPGQRQRDVLEERLLKLGDAAEIFEAHGGALPFTGSTCHPLPRRRRPRPGPVAVVGRIVLLIIVVPVVIVRFQRGRVVLVLPVR